MINLQTPSPCRTERSRSRGIPTKATTNNNSANLNGKQPISLLNGLGIVVDGDSNNKSTRTNYMDNVLLQQQQNNQRNRRNLSSTRPPEHRGQIYSKKSMDDLLNLKHLSVSPPSSKSTFTDATTTTTTRRVPISRISLKYLRPSLASSTNSLNSLTNHSSSTSSLSDHSKSCLKIDSIANYS